MFIESSETVYHRIDTLVNEGFCASLLDLDRQDAPVVNVHCSMGACCDVDLMRGQTWRKPPIDHMKSKSSDPSCTPMVFTTKEPLYETEYLQVIRQGRATRCSTRL